MIPHLQLLQTHTLEKSSQTKIFLTQHDSMPPALTNTHALEKSSQIENFLTQHDSNPCLQLLQMHTLEKSSQMENFLTQYDSMPPALTNGHTHQKNPHKWKIFSLYASSSCKCTHTRKILTNGKLPHSVRFYASSSYECQKNPHKWKISPPSMIPCLQLLQMHTHQKNPHKWKISLPICKSWRHGIMLGEEIFHL